MSSKTVTLFAFVVATTVMLSACTIGNKSAVAEPKTEVSKPTIAPLATPVPSPSTMPQDDAMSDHDQSAAPENKTVKVTTAYKTPAGEDSVGFAITVDQTGAITEVVTEVLGTAPASKIRQEAFAKDITAAVQGKKLSELAAIDRVGGSSLTTGAFNNALKDLKAQL